MYDQALDYLMGGDVMVFRLVFATLVFAAGLSGCFKDSQIQSQSQLTQCQRACQNYATRCGVAGTSSFSGSSSGSTPECVQMCNDGLASKSGSSMVSYKDLLDCVGAANSCLEIQNSCTP